MLTRCFNTPIFFTVLIAISVIFSLNVHAAEKAGLIKIPADIGYMLEDMYGRDKNQWPQHIYPRDVNHDGLADWIAEKKKCTTEQNCQADIFICIPGDDGKCSEYCYKDVKSLINLEDRLKSISCESSC